MMDLVRMHPCLMEIDLKGTPLQKEGQAAQVQAQLKNNAKDYMTVLRGMPRVPPKFVRVFFNPMPTFTYLFISKFEPHVI